MRKNSHYLEKKNSGLGPRILVVSILILGLFLQADAQRDKEYILKHTNVEALKVLAEKFDREYQELLQIAKEKGWPTSNLYGIDLRGNPIYVEPDNSTASAMTKTTQMRNEFGVLGFGMNIGMWEANDNVKVIVEEDTTEYILWSPRVSHVDLRWRITQQDVEPNSGGFFASHATHVAGTLVGNGVGNANALGMAPQATLDSYSSNNDITEMTNAAAAGLLISNHSYGTRSGWSIDKETACSGLASKWTWNGGPDQFNVNGVDSKFGQYDGRARSVDRMLRNCPFYLPVKSSGNDHNDQPTDAICSDDVRNGSSGTYVSYDEDIHPSGDGTHTSSISTWGNAKNILTVGNLQDDQVINESSSRGMTDDGRIKPDICGNGTSVTSTESASDISWGEKTGTSMSAPNVAGSLLLLQQLYEQKNGNNGSYMRSATLKGLVIHTATDLGNPGPDFTFGWGLLNAQEAATVINRASYDLDHEIIEVEDFPANGYSYSFFKDGFLKVTLCYTDTSTDSSTGLVNDLDMTMVRTGGPTYYPYVMNISNPNAWATTGDNDRDNVEHIYGNNLPDGEYTVYVNVEGSLTGTQPFSLIMSGVSDGCGGGDLDLGNNNIDPDIYYANDIICDGTVQSGDVVSFVAGQSILLHRGGNSTGFHAEAGSNFKATVLLCD